MGAERLQEQSPTPAPACHGGSAAVIESWKSRCAIFVESYRASWRKLRGELSRKTSRLALSSGGVPPTWQEPDQPATAWQFPAFA
jgi:hypothetical protein